VPSVDKSIFSNLEIGHIGPVVMVFSFSSYLYLVCSRILYLP
jgi:hypothetical protein